MLESIDLFLDHLVVERGLAPATVEAYARDLGRLAGFLDPDLEAVRVTRDHLLAFARHESLAGRAPSTRARALAAVRSLFRFLVSEGLVPVDVTDILQNPRLDQRLPRSISRGHLRDLLEAPDRGDPLGLRDRAALELLYATGLRASELVGLRLEDVRLRERYLRCTGKGEKERLVPMGEPAVARLHGYLETGRPRLARIRSVVHLFLTRRGRPLSRQSLWRLVRRQGRRAGLPAQIYPHLFRHTFATHLVEEGADLRVVQELLWHARVATTQVYAHVDRSRLRSVHALYHPRARSR